MGSMHLVFLLRQRSQLLWTRWLLGARGLLMAGRGAAEVSAMASRQLTQPNRRPFRMGKLVSFGSDAAGHRKEWDDTVARPMNSMRRASPRWRGVCWGLVGRARDVGRSSIG